MQTFSQETGIVVNHPNPDQDIDFQNRTPTQMEISSFQGRRPVTYDANKRVLNVGEPNWMHSDLHSHYGTEPFSELHEGYFGGQKQEWGNGDLNWYARRDQGVPPNHSEIAKALEENGHSIPNHQWGGEEYDPLDDMDDDFNWDDMDDFSDLTGED